MNSQMQRFLFYYKMIREGIINMCNEKIQLLKVSENRRFLIKEDGTPFFWMGDTAWELFHKLSLEETEIYLRNRVERKFNVIQAVALAEDKGLTIPNAYGRIPLLTNDSGQYDPLAPDLSTDVSTGSYSYWDHVDAVIDLAASLGLYIALLPTWGEYSITCWGIGPLIFNERNAKKYGQWLGDRYRDKKNIIWVVGGDRPLSTSTHFAVVNAMAEGLKIGDDGNHLITYHPCGKTSSSHHMHDETWLDFNMIQSAHTALNLENYKHVELDYQRNPTKPTLDGEPRYEDHPINFNAENGYFDDFDIRQAAYWAVFAGAFGHTYGNNCIWFMCKETTDYFAMHWKTAILSPGAAQMQHLRALVESRPFLSRIPDQSSIAENYKGANHLQATRGDNYLYIYIPNGLSVKVNMGIISGSKVKAYWYNPRNGSWQYINEYENQGILSFMPPSSGRGNDWVLVMDDSSMLRQ